MLHYVPAICALKKIGQGCALKKENMVNPIAVQNREWLIDLNDVKIVFQDAMVLEGIQP
jgi:hypothetical protein